MIIYEKKYVNIIQFQNGYKGDNKLNRCRDSNEFQ